jgi:hypothetical protein
MSVVGIDHVQIAAPAGCEEAARRFAETFIVGHEVGDMVAGHLEGPARLSTDRPADWPAFYPENERQADEFDADAYGFETMIDSYGGSLPTPLAIAALVATFGALRLVGAGEASATHPAARDASTASSAAIAIPGPPSSCIDGSTTATRRPRLKF